MRLLFVVHRYGYPGGSEIYVQGMAEESCRRGHSVAVFAGEHRGNMNGVSVTHDPTILGQQWDLVVVHGGDVVIQNFVLSNAKQIKSQKKKTLGPACTLVSGKSPRPLFSFNN